MVDSLPVRSSGVFLRDQSYVYHCLPTYVCVPDVVYYQQYVPFRECILNCPNLHPSAFKLLLEVFVVTRFGDHIWIRSV